MWLLGNAVILGAVMSTTWTAPIPSTLIASEDASECKRMGKNLFCDYINVQHENVIMASIKEKGFEKVFLLNINKLQLSDSVCIDIAVNNVKEVTVIDGGEEKCIKKGKLAAKKSMLHSVPTDITGLFLEESEVTSLEANAKLSQFNIVRSNIKKIKVTKPLVDIADAVIEDSIISSLSDITIGSGTSLVIQKSKVNIADKGRLINKGTLIIRDPSTTDIVGNLILNSDGILKVGNQNEEINVLAETCIGRIPISENPEEKPAECKPASVLSTAIFSVLFVLLLVLWIFLAIWEFYGKKVYQTWQAQKRDNGDNAPPCVEGEPLVSDDITNTENIESGNSGNESEYPNNANNTDREYLGEKKPGEVTFFNEFNATSKVITEVENKGKKVSQMTSVK